MACWMVLGKWMSEMAPRARLVSAAGMRSMHFFLNEGMCFLVAVSWCGCKGVLEFSAVVCHCRAGFALSGIVAIVYSMVLLV